MPIHRILLAALAPSLVLESEEPPTFSADIAPIVYEKCAGCHRDGEAAPFTLHTNTQVKNRVRSAWRSVAILMSHFVAVLLAGRGSKRCRYREGRRTALTPRELPPSIAGLTMPPCHGLRLGFETLRLAMRRRRARLQLPE